MSIFNTTELTKLMGDEAKSMEKYLQKKLQDSINGEISQLFGSSSSWNGGTYIRTPNAGLVLIQKSIQDEFLKQMTSEKISKFIENNFDRILQEELEAATRKAAKHIANKAVFSKANEGR